MNYVFLPAEDAFNLINIPNTTQVQALFVAVLVEGQDTPSFTVILIALDDDGFPTSSPSFSSYYRAGVAGSPATLGPPPTPPTPTPQETVGPMTPIPNTTAYNWIKNWNNPDLESLTLELFKSANDVPDHRTLRGYTYSIKDFIYALNKGSKNELNTPASVPALWLNFMLYSEGPTPPKPFGMTICLNTMPVQGDAGKIDFTTAQHYADLSRPCPPHCSLTIPTPSQA